MEIHFDNLEGVLKEELLKAKCSIQVVVGWLDFNIFYSTFTQLLNTNVSIDIIVEENNINRKYPTIVSQLESAGAIIKFQKMLPSNRGHMHHKFCIIDSQTVINGSYNWTFTANNYSFENFIIIRDNKVATDKFSDEFDVLKNMSTLRLQNIQYLQACTQSGCGGKLTNLLIYGPHVHKYGEMVGDIVAVCTEEPY
jgi:phosphatidylserine/phosphatidylglycerophosphate/cardiolipin synthase-like enzyme